LSLIESVFGNPSDFRREIHVKMKRYQYVCVVFAAGRPGCDLSALGIEILDG
jgi:hypothetical protein